MILRKASHEISIVPKADFLLSKRLAGGKRSVEGTRSWLYSRHQSTGAPSFAFFRCEGWDSQISPLHIPRKQTCSLGDRDRRSIRAFSIPLPRSTTAGAPTCPNLPSSEATRTPVQIIPSTAVVTSSSLPSTAGGSADETVIQGSRVDPRSVDREGVSNSLAP